MPLALYMNEHVPKPITMGLRVRAVDVTTAQEDGQSEIDDAILMDRSTALRRVMFSFDADMLREATGRQRYGKSFGGLVFAHPARISIGECIRDLEIIAKVGESEDLLNQIIYLPL